MSLPAKQALAELPTSCDWGFKQDTDGNAYRWRGYQVHLAWLPSASGVATKCIWRGYQVHLAWADGRIPLLCMTTSASVHDSQSTIPMMKTLAPCVTRLWLRA